MWLNMGLFLVIHVVMTVFSNMFLHQLSRTPQLMLVYMVIETVIVVLFTVWFVFSAIRKEWLKDRGMRYFLTFLTVMLVLFGINIFGVLWITFKYVNFTSYTYFLTLTILLTLLSYTPKK